MSSTEPTGGFLFLGLGLTRVHPLGKSDPDPIIEPEGVRTCRRNIIALAGLLVLAGLAGANPADLDVLGIKPGEGRWGVTVVGTAAAGVQAYWYCLKYWHLKEDGTKEIRALSQEHKPLRIDIPTGRGIAHKSANLLSNQVAFALTVVSLYLIVSWIISAHAKGVAT